MGVTILTGVQYCQKCLFSHTWLIQSPGVDPVLVIGGGTNSLGRDTDPIYLIDFLKKLHEFKQIMGHALGGSPSLDPPLVTVDWPGGSATRGDCLFIKPSVELFAQIVLKIPFETSRLDSWIDYISLSHYGTGERYLTLCLCPSFSLAVMVMLCFCGICPDECTTFRSECATFKKFLRKFMHSSTLMC